jgi:hypothetical protein
MYMAFFLKRRFDGKAFYLLHPLGLEGSVICAFIMGQCL